ncbi:MAG: hypothetical protein RSF90_00620 [Pygmaiobacter sp.]
MLCPNCNTEMRIAATSQRVTGDSSPETPTVVYTVQSLACRNPQCEHCGKIVQTVETELYRANNAAR